MISAESWDEALRALPECRPAAIVVSLGAPAPDELDWVRKLGRQPTGAPLLIVTPPADERRITLLLKAGASGYLFANDVPHRLPAAVQELVNGGAPMSPLAATLVLRRARRSSSQMAVLVLLARGHSYEDIALALDLSVHTVLTHLRAIYERLGASTKVTASAKATSRSRRPWPRRV